MKIFIINPNSDLEMTDSIRNAAETFAGGDFEIECSAAPGAPKFIETYEDAVKAAPGMIRLMRDNESTSDAFIVACHCDPNLDILKEIARKPVVGIGEASIKIASMLGHKFSIVSSMLHSVPNKEALVRKYYLNEQLASIRAPEGDTGALSPEEKYLLAAQKAVNEDLAEVIVLGCAGMAGLDKRLQEILGVPVLDGVICALIIAAGLVKYGVSTSKIRRYKPDY